MAQPSGTRTVTCPFCGQRYRKTNWMNRSGLGTYRGKLIDDTHKAACANKQQDTRLCDRKEVAK